MAAYTYDSASKLTGISWSLSGIPLGDLNYAYDGGGRIVKRLGSLATTGLPQAMPSATYDLANRLTNWSGTALSHDANGNMLGDGSNSYAWNARNQLAALSGANLGVFMYDGLGRRAAKSINGVTTQFLHDGLNPVQELSSTGTPTANLLTGLKIDEFFMRTDTAGARSYLSDILGSTVALSDSSGAIATTYSYEPFGKTIVGGMPSTNLFQFTGRENDNMGLYYYRERYYSPSLRRFAGQDPIESVSRNLSQYTYVDNDPISLRDPLGRNPVALAIGIAALTGGAVGWLLSDPCASPSEQLGAAVTGAAAATALVGAGIWMAGGVGGAAVGGAIGDVATGNVGRAILRSLLTPALAGSDLFPAGTAGAAAAFGDAALRQALGPPNLPTKQPKCTTPKPRPECP